MNLLECIVELLKIAFQSCLNWFSLVMEKTGMLPFYFAGILVVFGVGFLLSRFGSLNAGASDLAAASVKEATKRSGKYASGRWVTKQSLYNRVGKGRFEK